eukprot:358237-Chlamydomonas_euryale.AAC.9
MEAAAQLDTFPVAPKPSMQFLTASASRPASLAAQLRRLHQVHTSAVGVPQQVVPCAGLTHKNSRRLTVQIPNLHTYTAEGARHREAEAVAVPIARQHSHCSSYVVTRQHRHRGGCDASLTSRGTQPLSEGCGSGGGGCEAAAVAAVLSQASRVPS